MKPSEEFTIRILEDEDYLKLPYSGARESLGMSVMDTKTAYIRKTGIRELDDGTIRHEFDELMQQQSPHEVNGIRYKAWIPFIINALAMAAGSAAVESVVRGGISSIQGEGFGAGAKKGAISGAVGGGTAGTIGPFAGGFTGPIARAAADVASTPRPKAFSLPGFGSGVPNAPQLSGTTAAFAPNVAGPLSFEDFNTSLAKLDKNAAAKKRGVVDRFRGLGTKEENTAFNTSFNQAETSSKLARSQFIEDQKKLGSTFA